MTKPHYTAAQIKWLKAEVLDALDKLDGRGKYRGDMGNVCYADGHFANSLIAKYGCDLHTLRKWAKS